MAHFQAHAARPQCKTPDHDQRTKAKNSNNDGHHVRFHNTGKSTKMLLTMQQNQVETTFTFHLHFINSPNGRDISQRRRYDRYSVPDRFRCNYTIVRGRRTEAKSKRNVGFVGCSVPSQRQAGCES